MTCLCVSCHFRTLLPFTCVDDSCLSVMHAGGHYHELEFCGTVTLWERLALRRLHSCSCFSFLLTWLCASWSAGTPRLRHVRKVLPVYMSGGAFSLSFSLVLSARLAPFHRLPSRLFIVSLFVCPSFLEALDVWSFCTSALSVLPLR